MHHPIFGHSFAVLVALIILSVLAFNFLKKKKTNVFKNVREADTATSGLLPTPKGTNSGGYSLSPTETNNGASSPSTMPTGNHYEVFLNFSGQDTRKGFTDHLYNGLVNAGICVFKDDSELRQGEKIKPDLLAAIRNSKILIPILSVNYGRSRWCLDELVQIMECKKNNTGYIVLPIFYKVEPSHVRYQKGSFGNAFHTRRKYFDSTTLEKWKQALNEVSSLKGFDANGFEGELVKSVVQQVLFELKKKFELVIPENLVGIDDHVKKVMEFIDNISHASLFVGIHGMGGIGKTTLAKTIYNKLSNQFEHRSFIADVREQCDNKRLVFLQNQLIKDLLKLENQVSNKDEGIRFISSKFNGKKVVILLDDVGNDDQLKALAGNHNWFSSGSVIIITTRNKSILDNARVDNQYEHKELNKDNSFILFCRHAFRRDSPPSEFKDLTHDVVSTTGGLPLSLQVLGSFLCGKNEKVWGGTIKKLRKFPHEEVQKKLRISYEELTHEQKQIFLDIACFFIGTDKRIASYMWDACDFFPEEGIEVLRFLSLIKVGDDHELIMHDQLRDLGREIVRKENNLEPWNRSRLWDSKAVSEVLEGNKGTSKIEALRVDLYNGGRYTVETFKALTNLRFLQLDKVNLTGGFQNLFPQLRWLVWDGHVLDFELTYFHLRKLVVLELLYGDISGDWRGFGPLKMAIELKVLNLSNCNLRTIPNLSTFKSLEIFILEHCMYLEEIDPSISNIKTLVSLNVSQCWKLKKLPLGVDRMEELRELLINHTAIREVPISRGCLMKLETLNASNCRLLAQLPESLGFLMSLTQLNLSSIGIEELPESIGSLNELRTLDASYCALLAHIPNSIGNLTSLSCLNLNGCQKLARLPDSICSLVSLPRLLLSGCHSLRQIPNSIGKMTSLMELHLKSTAIEELPESIGSLKELRILDASYCALLADIPNSIGNLTSLSCLNLNGCQKLAQLPDSIGSLVSLSQLLLSGCHSLRQIPNSIGKMTSLTGLHLKSTAIEELLESIGSLKVLGILDASYCALLAHIPNSIGNLTSLTGLHLKSMAIKELPESIGSLKVLRILDASYCAMLAHIPNSIGNLTFLSHLDLRECQKLARLPDSIGSLVSLLCLLLSGCHSLRQIPDSIGKMTSLTELRLKSTAIEELPESIGSLKELKILDASYCALLAHIPNSIGNLTSLSHLNLSECQKLARLPDSIGSLVSLLWLLLSGCHSLRQIPDSIGKMMSLTGLHLKSTAIEELPESIGSLKVLRILDASYCALLAHIPNSISDLTSLSCLNLNGCQKLAQLPDSIGSLVSLLQLLLSGCHSLRQIPDSIGKMTSLTELHLKSTAIEELPESIGSLKVLRILDASYCTLLVHIPNSIGNLTSLSHLDLSECQKLARLPNSIGSLVSLLQLLLSGCHSLRQIPDSIGKMTSLTELRLKSTAIKELPESIGSLKKLVTLDASYCTLLAHRPNSIGNLTSLSHLDLSECQKLTQLPDSIGSLVSLLRLSLSGCHSLRQIPDSIGKLTLLTELHLKSTAIEELPKSIANTQNLRMLDIDGTPMIEFLDDPRILAELQGWRGSRWKNMEGSPSNNGQIVLPNNLGLDELQKLSKLRSRTLTLVLLKRPKTPLANNSAMDYQTIVEHVLKRSRPVGISDEVNNLPINIMPVTYHYQSLGQSSYSSDDLPKTVVITLSQGSLVKSMDFHPVQQILLLVGTNMGDVIVWEVSSGARIAFRRFKVWNLTTCSTALQASLANDYTASVNRVMWSPDGILFGVAYSKHVVHIYHGDGIRNHLELEAHVGSVNDLAFSYPNKKLCIVTCGEDKLIKVWDVETGAKQHTFEGHEAPVYSIFPQHKENIKYIFSTSTDGKIKAWLYDNLGSRVDYDAPGHSSTMIAYNANGKRLFSCGTNKEGESHLVEWVELEGAIKRTYHGLGKSSSGVVQFDTIKNRFLAAGDEFMVKFWDMNNDSLLTSTDANGGLLASPCIRFNKEGVLLAVSTSDNSIKILANSFGIELLRTAEKHMVLESLLGVF